MQSYGVYSERMKELVEKNLTLKEKILGYGLIAILYLVGIGVLVIAGLAIISMFFTDTETLLAELVAYSIVGGVILLLSKVFSKKLKGDKNKEVKKENKRP